MIGNWGEVVTR